MPGRGASPPNSAATDTPRIDLLEQQLREFVRRIERVSAQERFRSDAACVHLEENEILPDDDRHVARLLTAPRPYCCSPMTSAGAGRPRSVE
jgi:hypothetical protein